jgi:hypothetical protein
MSVYLKGVSLIDFWCREGEQLWLDVASTYLTWAYGRDADLHGLSYYGHALASFPIDRYALWVPAPDIQRTNTRRYRCLLCPKRERGWRDCGCRRCGNPRRNYGQHELRHLNDALSHLKAFIPNRDRDTALVLGDALSLACATLAGIVASRSRDA